MFLRRSSTLASLEGGGGVAPGAIESGFVIQNRRGFTVLTYRAKRRGKKKTSQSLMASKQPHQTSLSAFFHGSATTKQKSGSDRLSRKSKRRSGFGLCPLCDRSFPWHNLEQHASSCEGNETPVPSDHSRSRESISGDNAPVIREPSDEPIPGLFVYEDFITEEEEALILSELDGPSIEKNGPLLDHRDNAENSQLPWKLVNFNGTHYGKRWGVHCNLRDRMVSAPENPLPSFVRQILMPRMKGLKPMAGCVPNEANAIDYRRKMGHSLIAHVDDRQLSKEPIANLSLVGDCIMTFRNVAQHRNAAIPVARVVLPRRCLQVLTGKARYDFSHAIQNGDLLADRRVSLTMRESPLTVRVKERLERVNPSQRATEMITNRISHTNEPIPGLFLFEDFVTEAEETLILKELDGDSNQKWVYEKHSGRHCEKRYGIDHDLWNPYSVRPGKHPLPSFMTSIILPRLARLSTSIMQGCVPNEINSISYRRSQGHFLVSHVDDRKKHKEPIANLSLAGDCFMTYQYERGVGTRDKSNQHKVLLKRRCLQVLTGKVRYDYAHGIENGDLLSDRRVSVTMRETRLT